MATIVAGPRLDSKRDDSGGLSLVRKADGAAPIGKPGRKPNIMWTKSRWTFATYLAEIPESAWITFLTTYCLHYFS